MRKINEILLNLRKLLEAIICGSHNGKTDGYSLENLIDNEPFHGWQVRNSTRPQMNKKIQSKPANLCDLGELPTYLWSRILINDSTMVMNVIVGKR